MLCRGTVIEQNRKRSCWLVSDPFSPYKLCRRCHFQHVTSTLDNLTSEYQAGVLHPRNEIQLTDLHFLNDLLHPAREQAFLNLLYSLFQTNKIQFSLVVENLKRFTVFPILLTKRIEAHQPGVRCKMYRECMKDEKIYTSGTLCWNCWSCISWVLRSREEHLFRLYERTFALNFSKLKYEMFLQTGPRHFIDCCISLHMRGYPHHVRVLIDHFLHHYPLDSVKSFLVGLLQQPPLLHLTFEKKESDYVPLPLRDESLLQEFRKQIKASIKKTTDAYKEELVMVTWHPRRFFPWCLDIEEWQDVGVSNGNILAILNDLTV
jgi:hypothetical protein